MFDLLVFINLVQGVELDQHYRTALKKLSYCLKYYRRIRGVSQSDLAFKAGISFRNYQRLENGQVLPRVDTLINLAKELSLPIGTLLEIPDMAKKSVSEVLATKELNLLNEIQKNISSTSTIRLVRHLIDRDKNFHDRPQFAYEAHGANFYIDDSFKEHLNVQSAEGKIDDYILEYRAVDVWHYVSVNKLKQFKLTCELKYPKGVAFIEAHNQLISSKPEDARAVGYAIDLTAQYGLEQWINKKINSLAKPRA